MRRKSLLFAEKLTTSASLLGSTIKFLVKLEIPANAMYPLNIRVPHAYQLLMIYKWIIIWNIQQYLVAICTELVASSVVFHIKSTLGQHASFANTLKKQKWKSVTTLITHPPCSQQAGGSLHCYGR